MKNILKRSIVVISFVLLIICAVSCVNAQDDDSDITMMTLSKGGLVINYPSNWGCAQAKDRREYKKITKNIAQLIKWKGNDTAKSLIEELKQRYPRKPALLDELEKVEKKL